MSFTPDERAELLSLIIEGVETVTGPRFDALEADVAELKRDVAELKRQMTDVQHRLSSLENSSTSIDGRLQTVENDISALYELVDSKPVSKFADNKQYLALPFDQKLIELDKEVHHLANTKHVKLPA